MLPSIVIQGCAEELVLLSFISSSGASSLRTSGKLHGKIEGISISNPFSISQCSSF
jgi:hypothetical protein